MSERVDERVDYAKQAPDMFRSMRAFGQAAGKGLDPVIAELVKIRASQINRCAYCLDMHIADAREAGESDERIFAVGAWREAPYYTEAERAALALTECVTRLADRPDPVPDDVWNEAAAHFTEPQLAALVVDMAAINAWNRLNAATRQVAGAWAG